jgi:hypothetical protein
MKIYPDMIIPFQEKSKDDYDYYSWILRMYKTDSSEYSDTLWNMVDLYRGMFYCMLPHIIIWKSKDQHYINPNFSFYLKNASFSRSRFIIIKLTLIPNMSSTHANTIIYDKKDKKVIRFEPYGVNDIVDGDELDCTIQDIFKKQFGKVRYIRPSDYMDSAQWQTISGDSNIDDKILGDPVGYCLAWCFWFIKQKLNNPDKDEKELMKECLKNIKLIDPNIGNTYLIHIRDFASELDRMKNIFMKDIGIPKLAIYHTTYNTSYLTAIIHRLRELMKKNIDSKMSMN